MKFFSSDLHLFHTMLAHERGFSSAIEMNDHILNMLNSMIRSEDEFYILGDFSFGKADETIKWLDRLDCKNLYLIRGNHDGDKIINKISDYFIWIKDYYILKIKNDEAPNEIQHLILFHYPMLTWDRAHYGTWQLCGHSHGSLDEKFESTRIDIGWDCWQRPITYEDIKRNMQKKKYMIVDHHKPNE